MKFGLNVGQIIAIIFRAISDLLRCYVPTYAYWVAAAIANLAFSVMTMVFVFHQNNVNYFLQNAFVESNFKN